jgi:outer membrane lipoprotein-sorting protein
MLKFLLVFVLASFSITCNCSASSDSPLEHVIEHIANLKSVAISFQQRDSTGKEAEGLLIIDKPHKFRCNYYPPFPLLIVGNKNYVSIYDFEMEHISRIDANENIFNFLLSGDRQTIHTKFSLISVDHDKNLLIIKLKSLETDKITEIVFDKTAQELKQLKIFEDKKDIIITFLSITNITNINKKLFIMQDPKIAGIPKRYTKLELEKLFTYVR